MKKTYVLLVLLSLLVPAASTAAATSYDLEARYDVLRAPHEAELKYWEGEKKAIEQAIEHRPIDSLRQPGDQRHHVPRTRRQALGFPGNRHRPPPGSQVRRRNRA